MTGTGVQGDPMGLEASGKTKAEVSQGANLHPTLLSAVLPRGPLRTLYEEPAHAYGPRGEEGREARTGDKNKNQDTGSCQRRAGWAQTPWGNQGI